MYYSFTFRFSVIFCCLLYLAFILERVWVWFCFVNWKFTFLKEILTYVYVIIVMIRCTFYLPVYYVWDNEHIIVVYHVIY